MSLLTKKGTFTLPTTAQSVPITGVGFQPKAIILWCNGATATGFAAEMKMSFGFGVSSSQRYASSMRSQDNVAASGATRVRRQDTALILVPSTNVAGSAEMTLDLASLDADGFTLTLAVPITGAAYIVHYLALGGSDITNAFVGSNTPAAGTGNKAITGVGFQPDLVITAYDTNSISTGTAFSSAQMDISAFTSAGRGAMNFRDRDAATPTECINYQRNDEAIVGVNSGTDTVDWDATLASMDADGFTLNFTVHGTTNGFGFLALKGGKYDVRAETQKTSTGTKATTGLGFQPTGLLLFGSNKVAGTTIDLTAAKISVGASDGANEGGTWAASADAVTTTDTNISHSVSKVLQHATGTATLNAEADMASFDADGYTLDWTTADATAREFIGIAFGSLVTVSPAIIPDFSKFPPQAKIGAF